MKVGSAVRLTSNEIPTRAAHRHMVSVQYLQTLLITSADAARSTVANRMTTASPRLASTSRAGIFGMAAWPPRWAIRASVAVRPAAPGTGNRGALSATSNAPARAPRDVMASAAQSAAISMRVSRRRRSAVATGNMKAAALSV